MSESSGIQIKITLILVISLAVILAVGFSFTNFVENEMVDTLHEEQKSFSTQYTIQDSQGNILNTNTHFKSKSEYDILIKNQPKYTQEKINAIKDAIISDETIEIDNHKISKHPLNETTVFYKGWVGAGRSIEEISGIPFFGGDEKIKFVDNENIADIIIIPTNLKSGDGSLAWTNTIVDEKKNEIKKATITIYEFDKLPEEKITIITRHEMGHVLGLGHSSDPNDLMYPTIKTSAPYISHCDIMGEIALLHGKEYSGFVCE